MVICLERGADLHMSQLMLLPLTVSCFRKIQVGFAFLVPAHPGRTGQRAIKCVYVCVCACVCVSVESYNRRILKTGPQLVKLQTSVSVLFCNTTKHVIIK